MPGYVTNEGGEPFRPEVAVWLVPQGPVLGMAMGRPGEGETMLLEAFKTASTRPMVGPPHRPTRARVASSEQAALLRKSLGETVEILCAPTPEIDEVAQSMRSFFQAQQQEDEDETYLSHGITAEQMASFFRAAARLFRARPWDLIPDDSSVLSVSCPALDLHQAAISVIGQLGESIGLILFSSFDDFTQFIEQASSMQRQGRVRRPPAIPAHFALNFESGAEVPPSLRKEISRFRWEVASPRAYPSMVAVDTELVGRGPTSREVTRTEAIALALAELITSEPQLKEAWTRKKVILHTFSVKTHEGTFEVTLRAPHEALGGAFSSAPHSGEQDLHVEVRTSDGSLDEDWFNHYKDTLLDGFGKSPEAEPFDELGGSELVMDFGAQYLDVTVAGLTPRLLEKVLFEVIPRKLSAGPELAPEIVAELQAFFAYLKRAHGLGNMDACLRVLGNKAAGRLAKEMSDPRNFGLAKSFVMMGQAEGFDLSTKEGVDAWVQTSNARQAGPGAPAPPKGATKAKATTKAKAKTATKAKAKTRSNTAKASKKTKP